MGVPSFFRWITEKYPKLVTPVIEETVQVLNGVTIPIDCTQPNPHGVEFDNLYLDMNGIVHPCCHPEDKPAPETEEDMMKEIFNYLDRIMSFIRPRKLLYLAIDGVAPRAKMNQQRSRRFRAGQEVRITRQERERYYQELKDSGFENDAGEAEEKKSHFDSNCITPGTPFMDKLSISLKYYIANMLNSNPAFASLNVILSDASVPGEGEHKVMDFIRRSRNSPGYDPNLEHVLYGLDADLIMLSLATHEPRFKVLREDVTVKQTNSRGCRRCGKLGHKVAECKNPKMVKKLDPNAKPTPFVLLHVNVLREYLRVELQVHDLIFDYDFENALDDWIFLIFFVGNDFLPHLPTLEIREGAIDKLVGLWKASLNQMGGFISNNGEVDLKRAQVVMSALANLEDGILKVRRDKNDRMAQRNNTGGNSGPKPFTFSAPDGGITEAQLSQKNNRTVQMNKEAAQQLKNELKGSNIPVKRTIDEDDLEQGASDDLPTKQAKVVPKKSDIVMKDAADIIKDSGMVTGAEDTIRLGEVGYKERYYQDKFGSKGLEPEFRRNLAAHYIQGLCWVLKYYYQGCGSWKWFYPYHYPPFASDLIDADALDIQFELGEPLKPFEQLMGVLPSDSKQHLPTPFHELMESSDSPIIDFYPLDFQLDLNGNHMLWKAIVLLPFIEESRLLEAIETVYPKLTPDEHRRNATGHELLYIAPNNPLFQDIIQLYEPNTELYSVDISPEKGQCISGRVLKSPDCKVGEDYHSPLKEIGCPDILNDRTISVRYLMPLFPEDFKFPCSLLNGAKRPVPILNKADKDVIINGGNKNMGRHDYQRHEYYKGRETYERQSQMDDGFTFQRGRGRGRGGFSAGDTRNPNGYDNGNGHYGHHSKSQATSSSIAPYAVPHKGSRGGYSNGEYQQAAKNRGGYHGADHSSMFQSGHGPRPPNYQPPTQDHNVQEGYQTYQPQGYHPNRPPSHGYQPYQPYQPPVRGSTGGVYSRGGRGWALPRPNNSQGYNAYGQPAQNPQQSSRGNSNAPRGTYRGRYPRGH